MLSRPPRPDPAPTCVRLLPLHEHQAQHVHTHVRIHLKHLHTAKGRAGVMSVASHARQMRHMICVTHHMFITPCYLLYYAPVCSCLFTPASCFPPSPQPHSHTCLVKLAHLEQQHGIEVRRLELPPLLLPLSNLVLLHTHRGMHTHKLQAVWPEAYLIVAPQGAAWLFIPVASKSTTLYFNKNC